jgi:hypothetical protein
MRFGILTATILLAAMGCGGSNTGTGDPPLTTCDNGADVCSNSADCARGSICDREGDGDTLAEADDPEGCCLKLACVSDTECSDGKVCDVRRGICIPSNLCDAPGSSGGGCADNEVCNYVDGLPTCVAPPSAAACDFDVSTYFVAAGNSIELAASGRDSSGGLVPHASFVFTAAGGGTIDGNVLSVPASQTADITLTAAPGACTANVRVYPALAAGEARVVLVDSRTRQPISGATATIRTGGTFETGTTDADGSFVADVAGGVESISAFPAGHQWHTVIAPADSDVIFFAAPLPPTNPLVDGIQGTIDFDKAGSRGDIRAALVGPAIGKDITELNFSALLGESTPTTVDIEGLTNGETEFNIPEGVVLGLADEDIKPTFGAQSDREGPAVVWALAGRVALEDIGTLVQQVGDDLNPGALLGSVLPFVGRFDHAVVSDINLSGLVARAEGTPPPASFETRTITPQQPLYFTAGYEMPELPCAPLAYTGGANRCGGALVSYVENEEDFVVPAANCPAGATCTPISSYTTGAIVLSAVVVPNRGIVPLGLTAGLDDSDELAADSFNGVLGQEGNDNGRLSLDFAPPHSGLEGSKYVTVAIAVDLNAIDINSSGFGASILNRISDDVAATGNTFPAGTFLETQGGAVTAAGFTLEAKGTADFYRVNYDNGNGADWNVWFEGANTSFDIADLAPGSVDTAARTQRADIQAFKVGSGYEGLVASNFDELFAFDGVDVDNLSYYIGAWSTQQCEANALCTR